MARDRMMQRWIGAGRAVAMRQRQWPASWWVVAALATAVLAASAGVAGAQAPVVPDRIDPAPTLPPGAGGDRGSPVPRSETPLAPETGVRPLPDGGVVTPPVAGSTPVIKPPATGSMPVIAPPGSPGGDRMVVPK